MYSFQVELAAAETVGWDQSVILKRIRNRTILAASPVDTVDLKRTSPKQFNSSPGKS